MRQVVLASAALLLLPLAAAQLTTEYFGDWAYEYEVDAITDEVSGAIYTLATNAPAEVRLDDASFVIICWGRGESSHAIVFSAGVNLGAGLEITVDYRVDDNPAVQDVKWGRGEDGMVIAPFVRSDVWLDEVMAGKERFTLRLHPSPRTSYTYQFSLVGLAEAVEKLGCE